MQVETIDRSVKKKKILIRELCYRGEEKHEEKKEERQLERERERSMGRGETEVSDSEGVRREKQREERKSEKAYHKSEREGPIKLCFP